LQQDKADQVHATFPRPAADPHAPAARGLSPDLLNSSDTPPALCAARKRAAMQRCSGSLRVSEGYNVSDLAEVFGVGHGRVESWARRGLLGCPTGHGGHGGNVRFAATRVLRFIKTHASEYDLNRVDQEWFKSMLFSFRASEGLRA